MDPEDQSDLIYSRSALCEMCNLAKTINDITVALAHGRERAGVRGALKGREQKFNVSCRHANIYATSVRQDVPIAATRD